MEDILKIVFFGGILLLVVWVINNKFGSKKPHKAEKTPFAYGHKQSLMTHAENVFYKKLEQAVGDKYYIFPQIHLSSIVDHTVKGQNWKAALSHVDRKSVDFVLCDKENFNLLLAIELDDFSHDREDRRIRDVEVERILKQAQLPLLRFPDGSEEVEEIRTKILQILNFQP